MKPHKSAATLKRMRRKVPKYRRLRGRQSAAEALAGVLREIVGDVRGEERRPFPRVRDIAEIFELSTSVVQRTISMLKSERLLRVERSARIEVEPTGMPSREVRGLIALPASLDAYVVLRHYREFFLHLDDALRKAGYATALTFYTGREGGEPEFAQKLLRDRPDEIIWFLPRRKVRENLALLADRGVRVMTIGDDADSTGGDAFILSRARALREALETYRAEGLLPVLIACEKGGSRQKLEWLRAILQDAKIPAEMVERGKRKAADYLETLLQTGRGAIVVPSARFAAKLCLRAPAALWKLFAARRVLLVNGPLTPRFEPVPAEARADTLVHEFGALGEMIAARSRACGDENGPPRQIEAEFVAAEA